MSCRVALLKLERLGLIELPESREVSFARPAEAFESAARDWLTIETTLVELGRVWLVPVDSGQAELSSTWWAMTQAHHPLGAGPLCGAQMRYLVESEAGYVGALSFSAPAWRLAARDAWIGWDDQSRQAGLSKVVANTRFLILPGVRVPNLASHVLGQALRRLAGDWQARYGITPVLVETFVDSSRHRGTCYLAANWTLVGQTRGRGRQDRHRVVKGTIKDIWVHPLQPGWQAMLQGNGDASPRPAQAGVAVKDPVDWAEQEFGGCKLPDARLRERLLVLARDFYARPTGNIPQACASRAKTKAAYRFFDHKKITMDILLEPHILATEERVRAESIVLAVQDTTSLNYTAHAAMEGLGPIGARVDGIQGLKLHSTFAFNTEGTPLGFLDVQCWARDPEEFGKKVRRHSTPIDEKESFKWIAGYRETASAQTRCPSTMLVSVGDRESDVYELFEEAAKNTNGPKLLVRAMHNRKLKDEQHRLWETMESRPVDGIQILHVPRAKNRPPRVAQMEIRHAAVSVIAPDNRKGKDRKREDRKRPDIAVWAVLACEREAPDGVTPLEWMLLTTVPVTDFEQATERLMWYTRRWGIEVLHRTLKTGCLIEQRQLGQANRIEACLAIDLVVAWRIYHLIKLGREVPDAPCTVFFEEAEWKALMVFTSKNPVPPSEPPTLREAIRLVATLGGFLGRKSDGEPGTQTTWIGLQRLDDITAMWCVIMDLSATQIHVSSRLNSG
jgi:hypothetical protein